MQKQQLVAVQAILEGETSSQSRLAKTLHDNLSGKLFVAKMNLQQLLKNIPGKEEIEEKLPEVIQILDSLVSDLSRTAIYIMPQSLTKFGIKASLTDFCSTFSNVHFNFWGKDERLDPLLELMIYRTAYKLVSTVLQDRETASIEVQLIIENDNLLLTVQDNSNGIDPAHFDSTNLDSIRSYIKAINGTVDIYHPIETNVRIEVHFNLKQQLSNNTNSKFLISNIK